MVLPVRHETERAASEIVRAHLLGYDVEAEAAKGAEDLIARTESRQRLLELLRIAVVQEQLFKSGPFDDARNEAQESTLEQLTWFIHHRRRDAEVLSARFLRRIGRFLELHGVRDEAPSPELDDALLRLFQSRRRQNEIDAYMLAIVQALASQPADASSTTEPRVQRVIFEKLANTAVQRRKTVLATATWNLIYQWYDLPEHRDAIGRLLHEADEAVAVLVGTGHGPDERAQAHERLLSVPLETLVHTVPRALTWSPTPPQAVLRLLLERVYGSQDQEPLAGFPARFAARKVWLAHDAWAVGVILPSADELMAVVAALPRGVPVDLFLAAEPSEDAMQAAARSMEHCPVLTFIWPKTADALDVRTYRVESGEATENVLLRHFHSARPVASQVARLTNFSLERLPAPGVLFAARASAAEEERIIVMAELEQFAPVIEQTYVRVPEFEKVYLDAVEVLRDYRRMREGEPVWNRITFLIGQVIELTEHQMELLAGRLSPPTLDLGLEKVELRGRFTFGKSQPPQPLVAEWSNPVGLGATGCVQQTSASTDAHAVAVRAAGAGRAPTRSVLPVRGYQATGCRSRASRAVNEGRFEEFDLDDSGRLASTGDRPYGHNQANVVVGVITNWTTRFPEGLTRVLIHR